MTIPVHFWSYFRDLTGTEQMRVEVPAGGTVETALQAVYAAHPCLAPMRQCTLIAVGLNYQDAHHVLLEGDEVSLFPPVQGG